MERIIVLIFFISIIPYLGLPRMYDQPIVILLVAGLLYSLYAFFKKNNIKFAVTEDPSLGGLARDLEQEKEIVKQEQEQSAR